MHRIAALVTWNQATVSELALTNDNNTNGWTKANQDLQLSEWAHKEHFMGAVVDKKTGEAFKYRDLIKRPELREVWSESLANEIGWLT